MAEPENQNDKNIEVSENEDSNSQELTIQKNRVVVEKI